MIEYYVCHWCGHNGDDQEEIEHTCEGTTLMEWKHKIENNLFKLLDKMKFTDDAHTKEYQLEAIKQYAQRLRNIDKARRYLRI